MPDLNPSIFRMYRELALLCLVAVMATALPNGIPHFSMKRAPFKLRYDPYDATWEEFKNQHKKTYRNEEHESQRRAVFMDNIKKIEQHNRLYFSMKKSYYLGVNQFTDLTVQEHSLYNKLQKKDLTEKMTLCSQFMPPLNWTAPSSVDWRTEGYVTPVKDQAECDSGWAFSTTGSLEGQHFRKSGSLVSLSEQQLVDCLPDFGNQGCNGGLVDKAFEYINFAGGLESEKDYPYRAKGERCSFDKTKVVVRLRACMRISSESESESALMNAVGSVGPVSVAIDADHPSFQMYAGGVYDELDCSSTELDHSVLVVGYGSAGKKEIWLVKNSWGTQWGMDGYILMSRNKNNQCGIATMASFPVV